MGNIKKDTQYEFIETESYSKNKLDISEYHGLTLTLPIKRFIKILSFISVSLILLSLTGQSYRYFLNHGEERYLTQMFNLDEEINFPTYFSTFLLLTSSVLFLLIASSKRKIKDRFSLNWYTLSFIFFFMSMDEILMLHEQLSAPIRNVMHTTGFFYFAWLLPAVISLIIFIGFNINFLFSLPNKFQKLFFSSAFIYVTGAFLMEMVGGKFLSFYGQNNMGYALVTTIEESLELFGIILLLYALLNYVKTELPSLSLKLNG